VYCILRAKSRCLSPRLNIRKSKRSASVFFTLPNYRKSPPTGQFPFTVSRRFFWFFLHFLT
jgi:hypothetical protein